MSEMDDLARAAQQKRLNSFSPAPGDLCEQCRSVIDVAATPHVWQERVVCGECYSRFAANAQPAQALPYATPGAYASPPVPPPPPAMQAPQMVQPVYFVQAKPHPWRTAGAGICALAIPLLCLFPPVGGLLLLLGLFILFLALAIE